MNHPVGPMNRRPTIADLATAAGVSLSTVNRILGGAGKVRRETVLRVQNVAEEIGFYGLAAIEARQRDLRPKHRLGFLLQQSHRDLYQMFGQMIIAAARRRDDVQIEVIISYVDDLSPENIATQLERLGSRSDAIAVIAADHPIIGQAIETLSLRGVPVVAYVTDQSAPSRAGYVGTDNWKLGRTAAWFITQMTNKPGVVVVFIGNHRYQCQDISDASFRSFIREHAPHLRLGDSLPTHEEPENAYQMVRTLLRDEPDLTGIYVAGGGISGVLRALREVPAERRQQIRVICRDIGPETRKGLSEGLITAALCHPVERISDVLVDTMLNAISQSDKGTIVQRTVPFEIITPASV